MTESWIDEETIEQSEIKDLLETATGPIQNHPNFELTRIDKLGNYRERINRSIQSVQNKVGEQPPEILEKPCVYDYIHTIGEIPLSFYSPGTGDNLIIDGELRIPFFTRYTDINNAKKAEHGTLLYELRRKHYDIVDRNETEYITPVFENRKLDDGIHQPEYILNLEVPINYDQDALEETVEALDDICFEIDGLYSSIQRTIQDY